MVEEKGSVLKSRLGLENLKGLGDTLKQIKELKGTIDEAQKTLAELAKDNSPLGRALARLIEAQGLKALNEDNINISEEVRKTMAEDLKNRDKTIEVLSAENEGLKEDKVISEVTSKFTAELDKRLPQPGNRANDSGQGKLMDALEKVVADYMEKRLLGTAGDGTLTSEQIRSVVREEVGKVAGGSKKPEDMVDDLVNALTVGDRLREKLGGAGIGARLLQDAQGGNSGLRTDLVKALLEDERERLRITQEHEATTQRNKHLGTIADAVKENLGDGIAALTKAAEKIKASPETSASAQNQPKSQKSKCGDCGIEFTVPVDKEWPTVTCPKCGRVYTREEVLG